MKKLAIAAGLVFGVTATIQTSMIPSIQAHAKSYAMSKAFAKDLRNGTKSALENSYLIKIK